MTNFLNETWDKLNESGHAPEDIVFIGSERTGHRCTWEEFVELADFEYDAGYGIAKVAIDLKIVFEDAQMLVREEYDGSEWWQLRKPFRLPNQQLPIRTLINEDHEGWRLEEMNE